LCDEFEEQEINGCVQNKTVLKYMQKIMEIRSGILKISAKDMNLQTYT